MADHNENLSGQAGTFDLASIVTSEISLLLVGLSLACTAGTVGVPNNAHAPAGQSVTIAQGSISVTGTDENVSILTPSRENLILQSQTFDHASWTPSNSTVNSNIATAPDGTVTADKIVENSSTSTKFVTQSVNFTSGITYTMSVYAKMDGTRYAILLAFNAAQSFDLQAGTVGAYAPNVSSASIETVGDFYRLSMTWVEASGGAAYARVYISDNDGVASYLGDGSSGVIVWGAQIEENTVATAYIPTTTAAVEVVGNTISQGVLDIQVPGDATPSGQALTLAQGSIVAGSTIENISLSGQVGTFDIASVVHEQLSLMLTGLSLSLSQGIPSTGGVASDSATLTGLALTLGQGSVVFDLIDVNILGFGLTLGFTDEMDFDLTQGLNGQALTLTRSPITLPGDTSHPISGQSLSLAQGVIVVTLDWAESIVGQTLALAQDALIIATGQDDSAPITGLALTLALGDLATGNNDYPAGLELSLAQGSVEAISTTIFVELLGQVLTASINELCEPSIYNSEEISSTIYIMERCV